MLLRLILENMCQTYDYPTLKMGVIIGFSQFLLPTQEGNISRIAKNRHFCGKNSIFFNMKYAQMSEKLLQYLLHHYGEVPNLNKIQSGTACNFT